jgi:hypothetical protein
MPAPMNLSLDDAHALVATAPSSAAPATGGVRLLLRLEGLAVLLGGGLVYGQLGEGWLLFAALFFAPDLAIAAYAAGPRTGAAVYNAAHSYVGPIALAAAALLTGRPTLVAAGLVWAAHIGCDRALGFGLKYAPGFGYTHLGRSARGVG